MCRIPSHVLYSGCFSTRLIKKQTKRKQVKQNKQESPKITLGMKGCECWRQELARSSAMHAVHATMGETFDATVYHPHPHVTALADSA